MNSKLNEYAVLAAIDAVSGLDIRSKLYPINLKSWCLKLLQKGGRSDGINQFKVNLFLAIPGKISVIFNTNFQISIVKFSVITLKLLSFWCSEKKHHNSLLITSFFLRENLLKVFPMLFTHCIYTWQSFS